MKADRKFKYLLTEETLSKRMYLNAMEFSTDKRVSKRLAIRNSSVTLTNDLNPSRFGEFKEQKEITKI